jgi:phosphate transport system permease protein
MIVVLVLFVLARIAGGRPAGHVTRRQAARLASRSAKDARRFGAPSTPVPPSLEDR